MSAVHAALKHCFLGLRVLSIVILLPLSLVHTGNKVTSTRTTLLNRQQIGNKVERLTLFPIRSTRSTLNVFPDTFNFERIGNKVESSTMLNFQLCCRFVADSTKSSVLNSTLLPVCTGLYTTE